MAAGIGSLVAKLAIDSAPFSKGLKNSKSSLSTFAKGVAGILAPLAGILGGAVSVNALKTQIAAERKLAAVLKSTGGAAELSAGQIAVFASELQDVSNVGDEVTINAAAMLATFKNLKGDVFKDALASASDLSAVMGTDMKSSVLQLGKALNDPVTGLTALTRSGVTFTEQQKEQIKVMQESGDIVGAQGIILAELQSQFGGAAEALADPWTQAKNALGDVAEMVGTLLLPGINVLSKAIKAGAKNAQGFGAAFAKAGQMFATGLQVAIDVAERFGPAIVTVGTGLLSAAIAFKVITTAMTLYAARATIALALSGPAGWATLAIGVGVAAGAMVAIDVAMEGVADQSGETSDEINALKREFTTVAVAGKSAAERMKEFDAALADNDIKRWDARAERLEELKVAMEGLKSPSQIAAQELAVFTNRLDEFGGFGDRDTVLSKFIEEQSGFRSAIEKAQDDLAMLDGSLTKTDMIMRDMSAMGVDEESLQELEELLNQVDAAKEKKRKDAKPVKEQDFAGVMKQGSAEAFELLVRSQARNPQLDEAKKQTKLLKQMVRKTLPPVELEEVGID